MATKNISRTVIEGGRTKSWKDYARSSKRKFRKINKKYCHNYDDNIISPAKDCRYNKRHFQTDHLNPLFRFLTSRVGKNWNDIYSEICQKFDDRTIAGQHIFEHIQGVFGKDFFTPGYEGFYLNNKNLLCKTKNSFYSLKSYKVSDLIFDRAEKFLNGRGILKRHNKYYWGYYNQIKMSFIRGWNVFYVGSYDSLGNPLMSYDLKNHKINNYHLRQDKELTLSEVNTLLSFPQSLQESIVKNLT